MPQVSGIWIKAKMLVVGVVGIEDLLQPFGGPILPIQISRRRKIRQGSFKVAIYECPEEHENSIADGSGERLFVSCDVRCRFFGSRWSQLFGFDRLVIRITHFL